MLLLDLYLYSLVKPKFYSYYYYEKTRDIMTTIASLRWMLLESCNYSLQQGH